MGAELKRKLMRLLVLIPILIWYVQLYYQVRQEYEAEWRLTQQLSTYDNPKTLHEFFGEDPRVVAERPEVKVLGDKASGTRRLMNKIEFATPFIVVFLLFPAWSVRVFRAIGQQVAMIAWKVGMLAMKGAKAWTMKR